MLESAESFDLMSLLDLADMIRLPRWCGLDTA